MAHVKLGRVHGKGFVQAVEDQNDAWFRKKSVSKMGVLDQVCMDKATWWDQHCELYGCLTTLPESQIFCCQAINFS